MGQLVYSATASSAVNLDPRLTYNLSRTSGTDAAGIITGVTVQLPLKFSLTNYAVPVEVTLRSKLDSGYYAVGTVTKSITASQTSEYAYYTFSFSDISLDEANALSHLEVYADAYAYLASLKGTITVTVNSAVITAPTAPTYVYTSTSTAAPGAKITLGWSGAASGDGASITAYQVSRASSSTGPYEALTTVMSSQTYGATTVTAPTSNGASYYYKVAVIAYGEDGQARVATSSVYASVMCSYSSVTAPTSVKLSATNAAPGASVTLSWSGASGGTNNAISDYGVFRATTPDGEYEFVAYTVNTSYSVTAPTVEGASYYYKVRTYGTLSGYASDLSTAYAVLTCTVSTPSAPAKVGLVNTSSKKSYVPAGSSIPLVWEGAAPGVNNAIVGYYIYRDGSQYTTVQSTATSATLMVPAPDTAGESCTYTVITHGSYSDSPESAAVTVCAYSYPTAPTTVTVSNDAPAADVRVTLSWSGAGPGGYNDIVGYKVYRATSEAGTKSLIANIASTDTHASCYVRAPSTVDSTYYFWVATVGSLNESEVSSTYITVTASKEADASSGDTSVVVPKPTGYKRRGFLFGDYDTAAYGWTLTGWEFPEPEPQTNYVTVPGRAAGPLDYSTSLTGGDPRYGGRELTALFELSEGTRLERDEVISAMVNELHGARLEIVFPDDLTRYAVGRLSVNTSYSDMAHAEVSVEATCEPWRYSKQETQVIVEAMADKQTTVLSNAGRRIIVPDITVSGAGARVSLTCGDHSWTLTKGDYRLADLELRRGNTILAYSGSGTVTIKYREAIL